MKAIALIRITEPSPASVLSYSRFVMDASRINVVRWPSIMSVNYLVLARRDEHSSVLNRLYVGVCVSGSCCNLCRVCL